jgi:hypothetical protein
VDLEMSGEDQEESVEEICASVEEPAHRWRSPAGSFTSTRRECGAGRTGVEEGRAVQLDDEEEELRRQHKLNQQ